MRSVLIRETLLGLLLLSNAPPFRSEVACSRKQPRGASQVTFGPIAEIGPQPSPDGRSLAFEYFPADRPNLPQIWVMDLTRGFESARPLVDNQSYNAEFSWSPDSQWICYFSSRTEGSAETSQIFKVKLNDGSIEQLTHFPDGTPLSYSTSWSKDGRIAFEFNGDIFQVSSSGGTVSKLIDLHSKIPPLLGTQIRWSPDATRLVISGELQGARPAETQIWIVELNTLKSYRATDSPRDDDASWYDDEHILFSRGFSSDEGRVCSLSLNPSAISCLTGGKADFSPWVSPSRTEIFFTRGPLSSYVSGRGFLNGFHIWKLRLDK